MARSFDGFKTTVQIHLMNQGVKTKKKIAAEVARVTSERYRMELRINGRIYNGDECGFPLLHRSGKVMAPCGARCIYSISTPSKEQITTLACINAAGQAIPPIHVFPGQRLEQLSGWVGS